MQGQFFQGTLRKSKLQDLLLQRPSQSFARWRNVVDLTQTFGSPHVQHLHGLLRPLTRVSGHVAEQRVRDVMRCKFPRDIRGGTLPIFCSENGGRRSCICRDGGCGQPSASRSKTLSHCCKMARQGSDTGGFVCLRANAHSVLNANFSDRLRTHADSIIIIIIIVVVQGTPYVINCNVQ